jgi:PGF-CTERM protein
VANGAVYVGSADNNLYAVDADTGNQQWQFATGARVGPSPPAVANGAVYVGSQDDNLYAVEAGTSRETDDDSSTDGSSGGSGPGFGIGGAVTGLGGAAYLLKRWGDDNLDEE